MSIQTVDIRLIHFFRSISIPAARIGLFIIFFWFGLLKLIGVSPAANLVRSLYEQTLVVPPFEMFYVLFAILEVAIGILFLVPHAERIVLPLLFLHMVTTFLPLIFLPTMTWQQAFVPTLEGQYIIKNVVVIAAGIFIAAHVHPMEAKIS